MMLGKTGLAWLAALFGAAAAANTPQAGSTSAARNGEFIARNYPPEALKRGEQGRVGFELTIESDGSLAGCAVTQSSGHKFLDEGTCEFLIRHAQMKPVVDTEGRRVRATRSGYIDWKLPKNAGSLAAASAGPAKTDPLICKRTQAPGSLVIKVRRCMTKSEWALQERLVQDDIARSRDRVMCSDHGC